MKTNKHSEKSGNSENEDRRVRKTKRVLKNALTELILEKGYEEVSVQEVIDRADVGRTSFYSHFRSKEDLLRQNLDDLEKMFEAPEKENSEDISDQDFTLMMFRHLKENWRLAKVLLGNKKIPFVRNYVQNILLKYYRKQYRQKWKNRSDFEIEGAAVFTSGALLSLTLWWLSMSRPESPERMHEVFMSRMQDGADTAAQRLPEADFYGKL